MNSLERAIIGKAGYDHGWEVVVEETSERVVLASALHRARASIVLFPENGFWLVSITPVSLHREMARVLPGWILGDDIFGAEDERDLGYLLSQGAQLARTFSDEPYRRFAKAVAEEIASGTTTTATEVERLVRQRVGQNIYRESLMDYWGGACAVTGVAIPALLRASHAKPWAECVSDAERLNVFNGFLLCAHLDALFDRHLMTFSASGDAIFTAQMDSATLTSLGLISGVRLRWLSNEHQEFLTYHRAAFESASADEPQVSL